MGLQAALPVGDLACRFSGIAATHAASPLHHLCLLLLLSLLVRLPQDGARQMLCDKAGEPAPGEPRP